eukprot:XP_001707521.1 Hypothetical protein GL50803_37685 [Giardia lamblia ATCC 50803]
MAIVPAIAPRPSSNAPATRDAHAHRESFSILEKVMEVFNYTSEKT